MKKKRRPANQTGSLSVWVVRSSGQQLICVYVCSNSVVSGSCLFWFALSYFPGDLERMLIVLLVGWQVGWQADCLVGEEGVTEEVVNY